MTCPWKSTNTVKAISPVQSFWGKDASTTNHQGSGRGGAPPRCEYYYHLDSHNSGDTQGRFSCFMGHFVGWFCDCVSSRDVASLERIAESVDSPRTNRRRASHRWSFDSRCCPKYRTFSVKGKSHGCRNPWISPTLEFYDCRLFQFRRLLLAAMVSRIVLMPVQIWSTPVWWQFVGDTLPEMLFAAAWTLLVSFFVQLVGIATGTSTSTMPGIVIQGTAYVVYLLLITLQLWNSVASVLLYALLCCIYAALFGTVSYFCPRLLSILQPSLVQHGGLVTRISICTVLCISMFGAHTIGYARLVLAPPHRVFWWWNYGVLELLPSSIFLVIMNPSSNKSSEREHEDLSTDGSRKIGRTDSASSAMSHPTGNSRKQQETIALLKNSPVYGSSGKTTTT